MERGLSTAREWWLLVGAPPEAESQIEGYDPKAHLQVAERFASEQEALRTRRKPQGGHRGELGARIAKAEAILENEEAFNDALTRAQLDWRAIYALGRAGMSKLVEAIPTLHAAAELRRLRHATSQKAWEASDLADIAALSGAIVYCDIVVTERQWAARLKQAKLDTANDTVVLADLTDLPQRLL